MTPTDPLGLQDLPAFELREVVLVGPGRAGRTLALELAERGVRVQLVGRDTPIPPADLTWLLVPERALAEVAARVPPDGVVLHASGATDLTPLAAHPHAGSLHPLMTFPGPELARPKLRGVPAAVAGAPLARAAAVALAERLELRPFLVPGDRRLYHAAAVMAGPFAIALLADAAAVLAAAGVPEEDAPGLLAPLAMSSLANAAARGPRAALTGPVARGESRVTAQHLEALSALDPRLRKTYQALLAAALALHNREGGQESP